MYWPISCHHWYHTTRLRKSDVGSWFRRFHEDYHDPITESYNIQRMQHLETADVCSWLELCRWVISNSHMIRIIFFTDEAHFNRDGVNNTRNSDLWDRDNSHGTVESNYQHRFSVNVSYGINYDNWLVRTFFRNVWQVIFTPLFPTPSDFLSHSSNWYSQYFIRHHP